MSTSHVKRAAVNRSQLAFSAVSVTGLSTSQVPSCYNSFHAICSSNVAAGIQKVRKEFYGSGSEALRRFEFSDESAILSPPFRHGSDWLMKKGDSKNSNSQKSVSTPSTEKRVSIPPSSKNGSGSSNGTGKNISVVLEDKQEIKQGGTLIRKGTPTTQWEIDFYSRPVVDASGKKMWELLVCDSSRSFMYSEFFSSNQVNAASLRAALERLIADSNPKPKVIRYFRANMANTIRIATNDLGIVVRLSRRCASLVRWIDERMDLTSGYYSTLTGFKPQMVPTDLNVTVLPPLPLPDALMGEKWAFLSVNKSDLLEICAESREFNELCEIVPEQQALADDTPIPGVVIYSKRAKALAGWMSSVEICFFKIDNEPMSAKPRFLVLETSVVDRWLFSNLKSDRLKDDARKFNDQKTAAKGLHFLAVQNPDTDAVPGFWLLQEIVLPTG